MSRLSPDAEGMGLNLGEPQSEVVRCDSCAARNGLDRSRRLMNCDEAAQYLSLSHEQFQSLIDTRQITLIRIKGEHRIDSRDLDLLIEIYKKTALRRA